MKEDTNWVTNHYNIKKKKKVSKYNFTDLDALHSVVRKVFTALTEGLHCILFGPHKELLLCFSALLVSFSHEILKSSLQLNIIYASFLSCTQ